VKLIELLVTCALSASALAANSAASELRRVSAAEARQGVAVDADRFYAVSNSAIASYDKRSGKRIAKWKGDRARFRHINSCTIIAGELVCANSNFPSLPHHSTVEFFDPAVLRHRRTVDLGEGRGSITWVERHEGAWWVAFANYDGWGGESSRDHRDTVLVRFDDEWREIRRWRFPADVLERFRPMSTSGGGWGADGNLYVTGHDRPELYVLQLPRGDGSVLEHVATIEVPIHGQAIDWDESEPGVLYGISRRGGEVVVMRVLSKPIVDQPRASAEVARVTHSLTFER
jgi:hypothetical protein